MKIWRLSLDKKDKYGVPLSVCIGYFDGLHKGHQGLVKQAIELSEKLGCESGLVTFDPDPWVTLKGIKEIKHITTMKQRIELAEKMGLNHFIILDFTVDMASLSPEDFMLMLMDRLVLKGLVCGFDFHYGAKGKGSSSTLKALSTGKFEFVQVNSIDDEFGKISSSRICECIENGNIAEANELLGYPYRVEGKVIHGNAKGSSTLGFPTANCEIDEEFILPKRGVYIGKVIVNHQHKAAMINIGHNPTFNKRNMISIEAHILDFNEDIYGQEIKVEFYEYIREEKKFASIDALISQLKIDVEKTARYFSHE